MANGSAGGRELSNSIPLSVEDKSGCTEER
jgi:hypothetical protein